jgi:hypothetical protein
MTVCESLCNKSDNQVSVRGVEMRGVRALHNSIAAEGKECFQSGGRGKECEKCDLEET